MCSDAAISRSARRDPSCGPAAHHRHRDPSQASLPGGRPLLVDTGDQELDGELGGYAKVVTGLAERTMYKVGP